MHPHDLNLAKFFGGGSIQHQPMEQLTVSKGYKRVRHERVCIAGEYI
jgi:hypothetical protein